jgi:hypothetical protein
LNKNNFNFENFYKYLLFRKKDLVNRNSKTSIANNNSSINSINTLFNNNKLFNSDAQSRSSTTSYDYNGNNNNKIDRYYIPISINGGGGGGISSSDDSAYQPPPSAYQHQNGMIKHSSNGAGSIRSLPTSVYRGSPERSLPRSPDRTQQNTTNTNNDYTRPTSRISSSRPSIGSDVGSERGYDMTSAGSGQQQHTQQQQQQQQKYKVINYLAAKRSLTSCDESGFIESKQKSATINKNRQLQMGKAKIDLDTQPSMQ